VNRLPLIVLLSLVPDLLAAQGQEKVIDIRNVKNTAGNSFDGLWSTYRKALRSSDAEGAQKILREIRRLRIERNISDLEPFGEALVAQGLASLQKGEIDKAAEEFQGAIDLDPHLPDSHFGLALTEFKRGGLGVLRATTHTLSGLTVRLPTAQGRFFLERLVVPALLFTLLVGTTVFALVLVLRHGTLLLHDLQEFFGPGRGRALALAVFSVLIFLPILTLQGYGWLPLWWMALLFTYAAIGEKIFIALILVAGLAVGPLVKASESRLRAIQSPLLRASLLAIEGGPDQRAILDLEKALKSVPSDRDFSYLLGREYKKAGRYDDAAALYRDLLTADPSDSIALNNLGNIGFARGEFQAAIALYKQGTDSNPPPDVGATFYYNQSLAYLQRFDFQPAHEARSQADRLAPRLVRRYDDRWKYDTKNENAVVDLGLTESEAWVKFMGEQGAFGLKNVAGKAQEARKWSALVPEAANRFAVFLAVFGFAWLGLRRWRGKRMFTTRCLKCGTPFCKRCHLGNASVGLCTQCFHLFVVRDGVSGPARNQKLLEVQREDSRRERIFRALSLVSPGAGHLYAQKTLPGVLFVFLWYFLLVLPFLAERILPVTETPATLSIPWALGLALTLLLFVYVAANRARPDFEIVLPVQRTVRHNRTA